MDKKPYNTTLPITTIAQVKQIAEDKRWNDNDVIEVAVERYFESIYGSPVTVAEAQQVASEQEE